MFDACLLACALGSRHGCRHVLAEPVMASPASPSPNPLCSTRQSLHSSGEHEEIAAATETWPRMSAGSRHDPDKVLCQHGLAYISQPGRLGSCDSHLTDETSTAQTSPAGPSWGSAEGTAQGLPFPEVSPQSPVPALCQAGLCMPHSRLPGLIATPRPRLSLVSEGAAAGQLLGRQGRPSHVHVHSHARQDVFWWRIFQRLNHLGSLLTCSFLGPRTGPTVSRWETPESAFP